MLRNLSFSIVAGAAVLGLAVAPAARGAAIFDVNFNNDTGTSPVVATASDAPPANTKPSSLQGNSSVLIKTASASYFTGFSNDQFAVVDVAQKSAGLFLLPNIADQVAMGVIDFKCDFQIDGSVSGATGQFSVPFWASRKGTGWTNVVITQLAVDVTNGTVTMQHQTGSSNTTETASVKAALNTRHTLEAVITLNGSNSSVIYYLDAHPLETAGGVSRFGIGSPGEGNAFQQAIIHSNSTMTGRVGIDNVTLDISAVPEPASLGAMVVGGVLLLRRRHR
jgi:hypothetical protein